MTALHALMPAAAPPEQVHLTVTAHGSRFRDAACLSQRVTRHWQIGSARLVRSARETRDTAAVANAIVDGCALQQSRRGCALPQLPLLRPPHHERVLTAVAE